MLTNITAFNTEEPQQKYNRSTALEQSEIDYSGAETCFTGSKLSPFASAVIRNIWSS